MDSDEFLRQITIPAPCTARWESMSGGHVVRSCADCGKEVYNLSAMTAQQVQALVISRRGELCARIAMGHDGEIVTVEAPPTGGRFRFRLRTLMGLIGAIGAALGLVRLIPPTTTDYEITAGKVMILDPLVSAQCSTGQDGNPPEASSAEDGLPPSPLGSDRHQQKTGQ